MPPRPHFPRPQPHPGRRFYGRGYYGGYPYPMAVNPEPYVIEVEREPALPWRVTNMTSWGKTTIFQSASQQVAREAFHKYRPQGFNNSVNLEHWNGSGWETIDHKSVTNGRSMNGLDSGYVITSFDEDSAFFSKDAQKALGGTEMNYWPWLVTAAALGVYLWQRSKP